MLNIHWRRLWRSRRSAGAIGALFGLIAAADAPIDMSERMRAIQMPQAPGYLVDRVIFESRDDRPDKSPNVVLFENGDGISKEKQDAIRGELSTAFRLCITIAPGGQPGSQTGFRMLGPSDAIFMRLAANRRTTRTYLEGSATYDGPEDTTPGTFRCLIENGRPTFWYFSPT